MSTLTPIPLTLLTRLPGAGQSTRLNRQLHQPALARYIVEKAFTKPYEIEAMEARR